VSDQRAGAGSADEYRQVMGHFLTGVTIVTGIRDGIPLGFTCQSFASVSLHPRLVTIVPSLVSTSWPGIAASGQFCANILAAGQAQLARDFAVSAGSGGGSKFERVAWSPTKAGNPLIEGHLAFVDCAIVAIHEAGDHFIVVGEVLDVGLGADPAGRPLHYYRGRLSDPGEMLDLMAVEITDTT
jgi:3-hydroxy-9,10-secoandrosta-1,3,5(10)-triene-9,17-dione monooxygenase reductase component